ncbi:MAG: glycerol-3-phosphate 1-O-acyltransferase PlsY [Clostridiales bacterium]|nr:glycerol-3-phosphate 1-O-acyltransferase PlsY [Clostridiales bacterium]
MTFEEMMKSGVFCRLFGESNAIWIISAVVAAIFAYLLGSLNSGVLISRIVFREDIRNYGSGNAGTTNMMRTYGKKFAVITLLGDALKAAAAVWLGYLLSGYNGGFVAFFFCVVGHAYPVFFNFKGGKGVACTAAAILCLKPTVFLLLLALFILIVLFTKYISLGSVMCMMVFPLVLYRMHPGLNIISLIFSLLSSALVIFLHRSDIGRLWRGEENKFTFEPKARKVGESGGDETDKEKTEDNDNEEETK